MGVSGWRSTTSRSCDALDSSRASLIFGRLKLQRSRWGSLDERLEQRAGA
jgi:hypothetical protein